MNAGDQLQVRAMADDWPRLLLPQTMNEYNQVELIEGVVKKIQRLGLVDFTTAILDGFRPVAFIGGQLLWLAQPALGIFMDSNRIAGLAQLLEQPEAIDMLRDRLEEC
ncbi:MAG: hypothetical protein JXA42_01665 [Anaerolineales bacterium]|nr:hypothetical protein [Anaerolineales bacterium]